MQPNNAVFDNIFDEQPPQMNILNIIICCICNNRRATNGKQGAKFDSREI